MKFSTTKPFEERYPHKTKLPIPQGCCVVLSTHLAGDYPNINFAGVLIGMGGETIRKLQADTDTVIYVRGGKTRRFGEFCALLYEV